jgi:hypothetical protein
MVLSSVVNLTFLRFMDADRGLPAEFVEEIAATKCADRPVSLALDALPNFTCLPGEGFCCAARSRFRPASTTWSAPRSGEEVRRFRGAMDMVIRPDRSIGGASGKHTSRASAAPMQASSGRGTISRAFGDTVIDDRECAPVRDIILHRQVLTPLGTERLRAHRGQHLSGRLSLEQLFFARGADGNTGCRFKTCGCADRRRTHGGGIMGRGGNAA